MLKPPDFHPPRAGQWRNQVSQRNLVFVALIRTIPDAALDWQPGGTDWSLRQIVSHLAHANDFYVMIVDEVHASKFGTIRLHRELAGVQRMAATDAEPETTTLRQRVIWRATDHLQEHQAQLKDTLTRWQATHTD